MKTKRAKKASIIPISDEQGPLFVFKVNLIPLNLIEQVEGWLNADGIQYEWTTGTGRTSTDRFLRVHGETHVQTFMAIYAEHIGRANTGPAMKTLTTPKQYPEEYEQILTMVKGSMTAWVTNPIPAKASGWSGVRHLIAKRIAGQILSWHRDNGWLDRETDDQAEKRKKLQALVSQLTELEKRATPGTWEKTGREVQAYTGDRSEGVKVVMQSVLGAAMVTPPISEQWANAELIARLKEELLPLARDLLKTTYKVAPVKKKKDN